MAWLQNWDWLVLYYIQTHFLSPMLNRLMIIVTSLGNMGLFWIFLGLAFFVYRKTRKLGVILLLALFCELIVGNGILKHLVARPRPCWLDPSVPLLLPVPQDFSFPSGHSFASFISATVIGLYNRKWGIWAFVLAALIAFSRLYLFVHFPSDVLTGAFLGIIFGILVYRLADRYLFKA